MTSSAPVPATETPKRGAIAGVISFAAHLVLLLLALVGGGAILFAGETLLAIACLAIATILFRRDWRYTGVGIMAGWFAGLFMLVIVLFA